MKICVCCSLSFTDEVLDVARRLEALGHDVLLPNGVIEQQIKKEDFDPIKAKAETDAVRKHIDKTREADAILVCNYDKKGIKNYIGANTFLEMASAHYHRKPIYVLNSLPDMPYINDELRSFDVLELQNQLEAIG